MGIKKELTWKEKKRLKDKYWKEKNKREEEVKIMIHELTTNDIVQFNEKHEWCGCIGIINEIKGTRIMVGVPIPEQGIAYIYCKLEEIEYIGQSIFMITEDEND